MERTRVFGSVAALAVAIAVLLGAAAPSAAREFLEVRVAAHDDAREIALTETEFEALPQTTLVTHTPWTASESRFTGVLLRDLLDHLGLPIRDIAARALNDYEAILPASDIRNIDILIANRMDGKPMSVRDKGPLWIIYPLDQRPELAGAETEYKMVWQLHRLTLQ